MATKAEISSRRSELKKYMFQNKDYFFTFNQIKEFYNQPQFIDEYGYLSDSRIRADLKSLGIHPTEDNKYSLDNSYEIDSIESSILKKLKFFDLYRPMVVGEPVDVDFNDNDVGSDLWLYSIILKRKPSTTKSDSKFNIDYLINDLNKFYGYMDYINNSWYFDIIKGSKSIQFLFDDYEDMNYFYDKLVEWKKRSMLELRIKIK